MQSAGGARDDFFKRPILNSPYEAPTRHWELDKDGLPTHNTVEKRRLASFVTPIPQSRTRHGKVQQELLPTQADEAADSPQRYDPNSTINRIREHVARWRALPPSADWKVTPETRRLLEHWRSHDFVNLRPFFCQIEAVETAIWLTEVAPQLGKLGREYLDLLRDVNEDANPGLPRLALKLATGAGKTTVMAMLIAWQTVNAAARPGSKRFTRGFLVVAPGITIRDRLRVLLPSDPDSYYENRELVPSDMLGALGKAEIVITNYHAFKLRETLQLPKGARALLEGRGPELSTLETEGQMIQRVMAPLMGMKNVMVLNDEAHHCYRAKPGESEEGKLTGDARKEGEEHTKAARMWLTGLEMVQRRLGINRIFDLSATPFFLSGSGYREGTIFPWTMSDFSLMDAIECGIVKLPRVPVADNIASEEMPRYRVLWEHIGREMPKKGRTRKKSEQQDEEDGDPLGLPILLKTALDALYRHYEQTFALWEEAGTAVPPCFIVVCNNTTSSKLVHDYVAGFHRDDGRLKQGRLELFRNYDDNGQPLPRPRTLLIDSQQLESEDALDKSFRDMAAPEIERYRREIIERSGGTLDPKKISDQELLREVMNTVGKKGKLGESVRCVVSVAMLTEGWDANNVTHILGVRAFGTQLLCEQVVGRALRRQSYDLNEQGLLDVEYADILGIPFDFTAEPVVSKPAPPRESVHVHAVRERQDCEIVFPQIAGYRIELPRDRLEAEFTDDATLVLSPELLGPSETRVEGILGEGIDLKAVEAGAVRRNRLVYELSQRLLEGYLRDEAGEPRITLFPQVKRIVGDWLDHHLECKGGCTPAQLLYRGVADLACQRIDAAITSTMIKEIPVKATPQEFNPTGSTRRVNFWTTKKIRWQTDPRKCHVNWAVCDSGWEAELCRILEGHPRVARYVANQGLGFEVPYVMGAAKRRYRPDFIVVVDDGQGADDLLHLVVEVKGYRREDAKVKKQAMETYWVPGVNHLGRFGRWAFAELTDVHTMGDDLEEALAGEVDKLLDRIAGAAREG